MRVKFFLSEKERCIFLILLIFNGTLSCQNENTRQPLTNITNEDRTVATNHEIDSIIVSYLRWDLRSRGRLNADDVRDFNNGRNDVYVIKNKDDIEELIKTLSIVNMDLILKVDEHDLRMIMDFYKEGIIHKEVYINFNRAVLFDGGLYRSMPLYKFIEQYIPETKAPYQDH